MKFKDYPQFTNSKILPFGVQILVCFALSLMVLKITNSLSFGDNGTIQTPKTTATGENSRAFLADEFKLERFP